MRALSVTCHADSGELNTVTLAPEFRAQNPLFRADVLSDLLENLTNLYNATLQEMREKGFKASGVSDDPNEPVQLEFDFETQAE